MRNGTMHDDQVDIDLSAARSLIYEQFPQWANEAIECVPVGGTDNAIFRIGRSLAARFPLRTDAPSTLAKSSRAEAAAMTELAGNCPIATPKPVAIGQPSSSYPLPWSVQTWIAGEVATPTGHAASAVLADDIATLIGALRSVDTRGRTFSCSGRGGHLPDHDSWMDTCFQNSESLLEVPPLRELWTRLRELPTAGPDVMSHRDLIPANLLVDGEHLVGVLDGGSFSAADPALDLVAAWHLFDREAREVVRARLDCSVVEWKRGAAWALEQAMGLVWYYEHTNPGMSALGRSTLRRLLDDPEL